MRSLFVLSALVAVAVSLALTASAAPTQRGSGSAACLRGDWIASRAETSRVTHVLIPVGGFDVNGRLYMIFRDGIYQYGTTGLTIYNTIGDTRMTAKGRFFSLHRYTATPGMLRLANGERTTEWGKFTATKDGKSYTVPGPPTSTQRAAGGRVPFQCRGATLKVQLPQFRGLDWITLRRN